MFAIVWEDAVCYRLSLNFVLVKDMAFLRKMLEQHCDSWFGAVRCALVDKL